MHRNPTLLALAAVASLMFLAACGSSPTGITPYDGTVDPPPLDFPMNTFRLGINQTANLADYLEISRDDILAPIDDVTWKSSDDSKVSFVSPGTVRGVGLGKATVTASVGGHEAALIIEVVKSSEHDPPGELERVG